MKVLSVRNPYAAAIAAGLKGYETRSRRTSYRGPVIISAGAVYGMQDEKPETIRKECSIRSSVLSAGIDTEKTGAVCFATLTDCIRVEEIRNDISDTEEACGFYSDGRYAWKLEDVVPIPGHVDCPGRPWMYEAGQAEIGKLNAAAARAVVDFAKEYDPYSVEDDSLRETEKIIESGYTSSIIDYLDDYLYEDGEIGKRAAYLIGLLAYIDKLN